VSMEGVFIDERTFICIEHDTNDLRPRLYPIHKSVTGPSAHYLKCANSLGEGIHSKIIISLTPVLAGRVCEVLLSSAATARCCTAFGTVV
jgi:hypothetical protein